MFYRVNMAKIETLLSYQRGLQMKLLISSAGKAGLNKKIPVAYSFEGCG
jgi:hypothetical protein